MLFSLRQVGHTRLGLLLLEFLVWHEDAVNEVRNVVLGVKCLLRHHACSEDAFSRCFLLAILIVSLSDLTCLEVADSFFEVSNVKLRRGNRLIFVSICQIVERLESSQLLHLHLLLCFRQLDLGVGIELCELATSVHWRKREPVICLAKFELLLHSFDFVRLLLGELDVATWHFGHGAINLCLLLIYSGEGPLLAGFGNTLGFIDNEWEDGVWALFGHLLFCLVLRASHTTLINGRHLRVVGLRGAPSHSVVKIELTGWERLLLVNGRYKSHGRVFV